MEETISSYLDLVKELKRTPTYVDLATKDITRSKIRHQFGNISNLHGHMRDNYEKELSAIITSTSHIFSKKNMQGLSDSLQKYTKFFVTTAVSEKAVSKEFYDSIKFFCKENDAALLIFPCADIWSSRSATTWSFDPVLNEEVFIHADTSLNENLFLSSIKMSAKHINPTKGLSRISQKNGSYIFASPKQSLEHIPGGNGPRAMMTTGCITVPNYHTDRYMSERISYIAENDHVMGGIVVELDGDYFHVRQIQSQTDGSFVDIGVQYNPNGTKQHVSATLVMGDYHVGETDPIVKNVIEEICEEVEITNIVAHDFFDGFCINHHHKAFPLKQAKKAMDKLNSLEEEIIRGANEINWLASLCSGEVVFTKGNHDERLEKYLMAGEYINDPENHYISLDLARKVIEGIDPLEYAYNTYGKIKEPERNVWLTRKDSYMIGGVECGQHGDKGENGAKGSMMSAEKSYGNCIIAHSHSAAILRGVFRVGTSTFLELEYNSGPSSWTQTHALVYESGSRQLISIINGRWKKKNG